MRDEHPEKFKAMAEMEHKLTDQKGKPVTCLKNQTKAAKESNITNLFLLPHPDYPMHQSLADKKQQKVHSLVECNGFCGTQGNLFQSNQL